MAHGVGPSAGPRVAVALLLGLAIAIGGAPQQAEANVSMPAPTVNPRQNGLVNETSVPLRVSWPKAPATGSSVSRYTLQRSVNDGPWLSVTLSKALSRAVVLRLRPWDSHRFRVRATYANGQVSGWGTSGPLWLAYADETDLAASYSGAWSTVTDTNAHRGSRRSATVAASSVSFTFTGSQVAWVARYGTDRGRARVYVNDQLVATVDTQRARVRHRRVAFQMRWSSSATRTLRIDVEGTAGRPRVDVDAFLVLGPPTSETLVGAGDIGQCNREAPELTARLIEDVPGIVYTTGDNAYPNGTAEEFANCYDPSWGRFKPRTRPSPGNHDYATSGAHPYYDYFGANAGPDRRGWYTYQAGTWRIYSLNSEACSSTNNRCVPGGAQFEWLKLDLLNNAHQCVLAYWHRPRFSSGHHGPSTRMAAITQLLYDHGADVILAGHDHGYERLQRIDPSGTPDEQRGIRHFTIGTGGANLYELTKPALDTTETRQSHVHGVLRVDLQPGTYDWQFLPTVADAYSDTGSGACH
jgi:hypothetical protein